MKETCLREQTYVKLSPLILQDRIFPNAVQGHLNQTSCVCSFVTRHVQRGEVVVGVKYGLHFKVGCLNNKLLNSH